ncbi:LysM domain-containing protein [Kushneria avicenniae]|uniref:LysM domain-containing protein n=1 Tax=Kushneria avicenniae TaxID=402385 RepID=A0A1I1FE78_9GAMM|nr:M23 family metallopeptidase [Kushneria avicenniae]SFB97789.1 LysM domain-containing protein [Kushneria avicenniae]
MYHRLLILVVLLLLAGCAGRNAGGGGEAGYITVQRGDTMSAIARQAGIPLLRLQRFNPAVRSNDMRIGQQLMLPGRNERAPGDGQYRYAVRSGDTLGRIASHFGTSSSRISAANRSIDPNRLRIGQMLTVPVGNASASRPSGTAGARTTPAPVSALPKGAGPWSWPLRGGQVQREFGKDGRDALQPMLISAGSDRTARAVASGTVRFAGTMRQLGGVVIIHHDQNLQSVYAQCDRLEVSNGQRINAGTPVCEIRRDAGTGRHDLLFDTRNAGRPFNPRQIVR